MLKIPLPSPSKLGWGGRRGFPAQERLPFPSWGFTAGGRPKEPGKPWERSCPIPSPCLVLATLGTRGGDSSRRGQRGRAGAGSELLG